MNRAVTVQLGLHLEYGGINAGTAFSSSVTQVTPSKLEVKSSSTCLLLLSLSMWTGQKVSCTKLTSVDCTELTSVNCTELYSSTWAL